MDFNWLPIKSDAATKHDDNNYGGYLLALVPYGPDPFEQNETRRERFCQDYVTPHLCKQYKARA